MEAGLSVRARSTVEVPYVDVIPSRAGCYLSTADVVLSKGFRNPRGTQVRVWRVGVRVGNV